MRCCVTEQDWSSPHKLTDGVNLLHDEAILMIGLAHEYLIISQITCAGKMNHYRATLEDSRSAIAFEQVVE